jgi:hypothetical protein
LDDEYYLDGGEEYYGVNNKGNYPNDPFDDQMVNADIHVIKNYSGNNWADWCLIIGKESLEDGHEVFVRYGKQYWCFRPSFNTLSLSEKLKCMAYYKIKESDIFDAEEEPASAVAGSTAAGVVCSSTDTADTRNTKAHGAAKKKK